VRLLPIPIILDFLKGVHMAWDSGKSPHYKKMMVFIDGSNLLIEMSKKITVSFRADKPPATALTLSNFIINQVINGQGFVKIRRYWFASYQGDEQYELELCKRLRKLDFEPILFKKRNGKEKGVDISLTMKVLLNAINQNYDIAYMIAGDEDYLGLVREVKRYGPIVYGSFFSQGLSERLKLEFDAFTNLDYTLNQDRAKELVEDIRKELNC